MLTLMLKQRYPPPAKVVLIDGINTINRPASVVFSTFDWDEWAKIRQLKDVLKLVKMPTFNVMCWIAPQSHGILQTFVWW